MKIMASGPITSWQIDGETVRDFIFWGYYDYTVEVTNRFKGLDLIRCLKNYGLRFVTLYRGQ